MNGLGQRWCPTNWLETKSHDTRTLDTEDTKIRVFDTRHDDPRNRTRGTRFIYIYILKNDIYIKKIHKDLHFLKTRSIYNHQCTSIIISFNCEIWQWWISNKIINESWTLNHKLHIWYFWLNHKNQNVLHRYRENAIDKYKIE